MTDTINLGFGDKAIRKTKNCWFMGTIQGLFETRDGRDFYVMECYSGCITYGPTEEFHPDIEQDVPRHVVVIRDRSDEPAEKVLPPIVSSRY